MQHQPKPYPALEHADLATLTRFRRDLHRIPELDFDLPQTLAYVRGVLEELVPVARQNGLDLRLIEPCRSSLCALFTPADPTAAARPAIAFRTDMDALPVDEKSAVPFASTHPGRMHACGHDGHMAMLLGLATELARLDQAKSALPQPVMLVFQPAEETTGGAKVVCESGVFAAHGVEKIFGFHLWPDLPAGVVASRAGALLAASNETTVTFTGLASHIAKADQGRDALVAGCNFLTQAYRYAADCAGLEPCLLKFGRMQAGSVRNQIAATATLEGSLRTFSLAMGESMRTQIPAIADEAAVRQGCTAEVRFSEGYPPVTNDAAVFEQVRATLPHLRTVEEPLLIAEDFAWYQQYLPGVFMLLGTGTGIPLHADTFDFDEKILATGVAVYLALAGIRPA